MANIFKQAWWALLLRGVLAIIIALLLLFQPGLTLATGAVSFVVLFGVYALMDGVAIILSAVMRREGQWLLLVLLGVISVIAGLAALGNPLLVAAVSVRLMIFIISFKVIAGGIVEIMAAWQLRQEIEHEWLMLLNGVFSVLFGLVLLRQPGAALAVVALIAAFYLLFSGVLLCLLAFRVRGWAGKVEELQTAASAG